MKKLVVLVAMMIGMVSASLVGNAEDIHSVTYGNVQLSLPASWEVTGLDQASLEEMIAGRGTPLLSAFAQNKGSIGNVTMAECALEGETVMVAVVEPRDQLAMLLTLHATIGDAQEAKVAGMNHDFFWVDDLSAYLVAVDNLSYLYFIVPENGARMSTDFLNSFAIEALI